MTKPAFLAWLDQFRYVGNIKAVVEARAWTEPELDRLKENLMSANRLQMKNEFKRRMAWG